MTKTKKAVITVPQLFSMLFISRLIVSMTYSLRLSNSTSMWDHILSAGISFIVTFLLVIPVYSLFSSEKKFDIVDTSYNLMGKAGTIITFIYIIYYIFVCSYTLSVFIDFVSNVINPPISTVALSIAVILSSWYGASRGIEGLARTSGIILFVIGLSIFFIIISLMGSLEATNYQPLLYNGTSSMWNGVLYMISRTSCIPAMAMLIPKAKGSIKKGILFWNVSIYALIACLIVLIVGALGSFLDTQLFPVYTAASIAKLSSLQHMDALYLGVWTMGVFVKISLFLMISAECTNKVFKIKNRSGSLFIISLIVFILSMCFGKDYIYKFISNNMFLLSITVLTAFIIPLILLIFKLIKNRKEVKA